MLDGDTCFRPLSGKGLSNKADGATLNPLHPSFRPLSGKGLSNKEVISMYESMQEIVFAPCRGKVFQIDIFRFTLTGNLESFSPPVGERSFKFLLLCVMMQ